MAGPLLGFYGEEPEEPKPDADIIQQNVSGGLAGPQPFPGSAPSAGGEPGASGDSSVDCKALFIDPIHEYSDADEVIGSFSHTMEQAMQGPYVEGYGPVGSGYCLPDQTLGAGRIGYRGQVGQEDAEPMPMRPPAPDWDDDYDEGGEEVAGRRGNTSQVQTASKDRVVYQKKEIKY